MKALTCVLLAALHFAVCEQTEIKVDVKSRTSVFRHFWESTGLSAHRLKPRFELMGYPIKSNDTFLINFHDGEAIGKQFWQQLVEEIASRYIARFGANEVSSWKFELWNEPDLRNYNLLNFTLAEYLQYANGCAEGLKNAFSKESVGVTLGGPAGLFREENHPLCWGLLEACDSSEKSQCPIQFISFHRKGDGTAEGVLNGTLELLDLLHNKFPNLIEMPIANDESDIITTWSDSWDWRGDARYAAMVVKVIATVYKSVTLDRKLKIELLSNDNGFLNYHPFYFTQRTLFARFQMNHTDPPHNQFIKKPVYVAMALLSFLGDEYLNQEINLTNPLLTVMSTRTTQAFQSTTSILLTYANGTEVNIETIKSVKLGCGNNLELRFFRMNMCDGNFERERCIRTYEVEFESKCENSLQFKRVNTNDTIFLSYHHAATGDGACETTIGRYRVRAVDYWDQPGNYSEIVSFP
ncbi:alpha-L-iduronidase [Asbolus verrucosus]|uniref:Alpha-L-iduronidase n=1 Tax=Asbolus verrucosus TaxID=1661398 RepID=A0A482VD42_ASBVE|nr:alpha-L-iduronidase [Asbolus verrucosus]